MNEKDSGEFWAASRRVDSHVYEQTRSSLTHIAVKKWMQMLNYCETLSSNLGLKVKV